MKNGWFMISPKPESLWQPSRSAGFLLRKPFKIEAAFTESDLGILIVFSRITLKYSSWLGWVLRRFCHLEKIIFCVLIGVVCGADNVERRSSREHFIKKDSEGPPVHRETVTIKLVVKYLRCHLHLYL